MWPDGEAVIYILQPDDSGPTDEKQTEDGRAECAKILEETSPFQGQKQIIT